MLFKKIRAFFLFILFTSFQMMAVEMTPLERKWDQDGAAVFYGDIARMSNILNHPSRFWYFSIREYPKLAMLNGPEDLIGDISFDSNLSVLRIILYVRCAGPTGYQEREQFSLNLQELIMKACREFISKDILTKEVELVVKHLGTKESNGNTLFIWNDGHFRYFPKFFEDNLNLDLDQI